MSARTMLQLARWLGPWTPDSQVPDGVVRTTMRVPPSADRPGFDAWLYRSRDRAPVGAYLVAPGLHYAGPADPRFDRFMRVLARAGIVACCPRLPDYAALRVRASVIADFARAFDAFAALADLPVARPGVFSISFGSLPALRLAADPAYADRIAGVVTFGGFADFHAVMTFALGGEEGLLHDPLNRPVVVMNVLDDTPDLPAGIDEVIGRWTAYMRATWGREAFRTTDAWRAIAEEHGDGLRGDELALYRLGTGLDDGAIDFCRAAIARSGTERAFLDPRPHLHGLRAPVHIVHGADDDVIHHSQLDALLEAMPSHVRATGYKTGLFAHSHKTPLAGLRASAGEAVTLVRMLRAMAGAAR